jgi:hypothetical protein
VGVGKVIAFYDNISAFAEVCVVPDTKPPVVISVKPVGYDIPLNASIEITFSERMATAETQNAVSIYPEIQYRCIWNLNSTTITLTPHSLADSTLYTVIINASRAMDCSGNYLDGNANGTAEYSPKDDFYFQFVTVDKTPPTILYWSPRGVEIAETTVISVMFNERMAVNITSSAFKMIDENGNSVNGTLKWHPANTGFEFIPSQNLQNGMKYTVFIKGCAADIYGNTLDSDGNGIGEGSPKDDFSWYFQIRSAEKEDNWLIIICVEIGVIVILVVLLFIIKLKKYRV